MKAEAIVSAIHGAFNRWIHLDNWWLIDVVCGSVLGTKIPNGLPIWLAIVGPPGSAKTVVVEALRGMSNVYGVGGFTPHTFASGMIRKKSDKRVGILEKISDRGVAGPDGPMYYSDSPKFFAFNDFATLFSMRSDTKTELLSQMRGVYDGHFEWEWGTGRKMDWFGRVGAVAASTEVWDSQFQHFRAMGERFLIWREYRPSGIQPAIQAMKQLDEQMTMELMEAMALLDLYDIPDDIDIGLSKNWLAHLAEAVAVARAPISRDRFTREPTDRARPESGARVAKQLAQLTKGMMLFRNESSDHEQVRYPVLRAAIGSIQQIRVELIGELPVDGAEVETIAARLHVHRNVIKRAAEDLLMLRVLEKEEGSRRVMPSPRFAEFCGQVRDLWKRIKPREDQDE